MGAFEYRSGQDALYILWMLALAAQLLMPPALMLVRWVRPSYMPIWAILLLLFPGGWVLANVQVHVGQAYLDAVVRSIPDPDINDPIVRIWMADGARMVFAAFFGWLYEPAIWVLWSPAFAAVWIFRSRRPKSKGANDFCRAPAPP